MKYLILLLMLSLLAPSFLLASNPPPAPAPEQPRFVWTPKPAPWAPMTEAPVTIEMKPEQIAPKGVPPSALRRLLTRVLGATLGGVVARAGVVYSVVVDAESKRREVAYAIEQLKKNGEPINPQTIHEWIAQNHGIETTPSAKVYTLEHAQSGALPSVGDYIHYGTRTYEITSLDMTLCCVGGVSLDVSDWGNGNYKFSVYLGFDFDNEGKVWVYNLKHVSDSLITPPDGFDPDDYPELYSPENFPKNAIDALFEQGIENFTIEMVREPNMLEDHIYIDIEAVSQNENGETDGYSNGQKYKLPFVPSDVPKYNAPSNSVTIETEKGDTVLSKGESQPFIDSGIPEGSKIIKVNPESGTVTYINPATGKTETAQVPPSAASNLTNNYPVYNTYNNNTSITNINKNLKVELPEVKVSGSIEKPERATLEPVSEDRIAEAKLGFDNAWSSLKDSVSGIFDANLSGSGRLPVWHWQVLGKSVVIDFNNYSTELNWIGLAGLFMASLSAIFIVLGK